MSEMDDRWLAARSLDDLANLTVQWLLGEINETPCHPEPDEETREITDELIMINQLGFLTDNSQPGYLGDHAQQRACVSGYCTPGIAARLIDAGMETDLIVLAAAPNTQLPVVVPVGRGGSEPPTVAGDISPRPWESWADGISAEAQIALRDAWSVEILDPVWGRNTMWATLIEQLIRGHRVGGSEWLVHDELVNWRP